MAKWQIDLYQEEVGNCCGIGVFYNIFPYKSDESVVYYPNGVVIAGRSKYEVVKKLTALAKKEYMRTVVNVPTNSKRWRELLQLLLDAGWKDLGPSRSRMARYNIHILEVQRPLRKRKPKAASIQQQEGAADAVQSV